MTDRDWIRRVMAHKDDLPVPYHFAFSPPARARAQAHYGEDLDSALQFPIRMTAPCGAKPLYADPQQYGGTVLDDFGVVWSTSKIDRGAPIGPCLVNPDLSGYRFPDPAVESRFDNIGPWCKAQEGHYRIIWVGALWEQATFMRGMDTGITLQDDVPPENMFAAIDEAMRSRFAV